ncbi:MAG: hypothetical protein V1844_27435 [Pseudomonadota bacterium]
MGLLKKLCDLGVIPEMPFSGPEKEIIGEFVSEEARVLSKNQIDAFIWAQLDQIPTQYVIKDGNSHKGVLYGINPENGDMAEQGVLVLRDREVSSHNVIKMEIPHHVKLSRQGKLTVRNRNGERTDISVQLNSEQLEITFPLPKSEADRVFETLWSLY